MSKFYLGLAQRLVRVSDSSGNTFFVKRKKIAADSVAPLPRGNPQILEQSRIGKYDFICEIHHCHIFPPRMQRW